MHQGHELTALGLTRGKQQEGVSHVTWACSCRASGFATSKVTGPKRVRDGKATAQAKAQHRKHALAKLGI